MTVEQSFSENLKYIVNYRIPSKQFKKSLVKHFICIDGVPYYPVNLFNLEGIKRLKTRELSNLETGTKITLLY